MLTEMKQDKHEKDLKDELQTPLHSMLTDNVQKVQQVPNITPQSPSVFIRSDHEITEPAMNLFTCNSSKFNDSLYDLITPRDNLRF